MKVWKKNLSEKKIKKINVSLFNFCSDEDDEGQGHVFLYTYFSFSYIDDKRLYIYTTVLTQKENISRKFYLFFIQCHLFPEWIL